MELSMTTLKRLLLAVSMSCLVATANATPMDDAFVSHGRGDYAEALKIFRPLAEQGNAKAQSNLGVMYNNGQGVTQDYKEAVKWYGLAAAQGDASAQHLLGTMYDNGQGVTQDFKEAVKWYRLAAAEGVAIAQFDLGLMHAIGEGVTQDYASAYMWFDLASAAGHADPLAVVGAKNRDMVAKEMTPQQIEKAQEMARACQARNFKGC